MKEHLSQRQHFIGSILLIAGCCIGGGMLGLPLATSLAGFLPASVLLTLAWAFMLSSGLLLVEVYLYFDDHISLGTMAKRTLGNWGETVCWFLFLFLFYSLLVAYVAGSGSLINDISMTYFGTTPPLIVSSFILTLFVGVFIYLGTESTDQINRLMMAGLIFSYLLLVIFAAPKVSLENLNYSNWSHSLFILPTFIVSFGYHNLVPGISHYLKRNLPLIRSAVVIGCSLPFIIYLIWEWCLLGIIPVEGESGFREALTHGYLAPQILRGAVGYSIVSEVAQAFAFFAIITSFLTVALSITDFLADGLHLPKDKNWNNFLLCLLVLIPPFIFGLADPTLFLVALNYAGGIGAVALYGLLPVFMVWRGRYQLKIAKEEVLFGGKPLLLLILGLSIFIIVLHIIKECA